jgi:ABC-type branched-subunit amino acid transport system substrate-binding protein
VERSFRRVVSLGLASIVTLATWATTGDARSNIESARRTASKQLRVALVIPKSGPFTLHNRLLADGATVAAGEINANGASKGPASVRLRLKVVAVPPTASPERIVRGLMASSTRILILPCDVELQVSLARAATKAGLLTLSPCNPDPNLATTLSRFWPTGATASAQVGQLVFYAKARYMKAKTAFLLGAAHSWYAHQMTTELRAFAKRDRVKIVGEASGATGPDAVASLASRIREADPEVVFAAIPSPTVEAIISELRQKQVKSSFFVTDGMDAGIDFFRYRNGPVASTIDGVVFATFGFPRTTSSSGPFDRDYAAAYGKKPAGSFPGLGYETVRVLETAARRAQALTPAGINASFAKGFTVKGVALEDIRYRGHGRRLPVTSVGVAEVIRDGYVPLFTSVAGHPTG